MSGCGCSKTFAFNPGTGIDEQSNANGEATWHSGLTGSQPSQGISGRAPYNGGNDMARFAFCRKCFFFWTGVFVLLAILFFRK